MKVTESCFGLEFTKKNNNPYPWTATYILFVWYSYSKYIYAELWGINSSGGQDSVCSDETTDNFYQQITWKLGRKYRHEITYYYLQAAADNIGNITSG